MEMQFFWIADQVKQSQYNVRWHPGQENLADYFTKAFTGKHHLAVRPWYLHEDNSPRYLPRAAVPATLRGCVGTLQDGYIKSLPLPCIHAGNKQVPIARVATAIQAIRVAILPIANMFARTHNPLP